MSAARNAAGAVMQQLRDRLLQVPAGCRRLLAREDGNAAIEMAFAAPALFLLLFGIIECGRALWLQNLLTYSVAEAARCATVNQTNCGTADQIRSYASSESGGNFTSSVFSFTTPSCGNQVSASYAMTMAIMNLSLPVTLSAQACYPS